MDLENRKKELLKMAKDGLPRPKQKSQDEHERSLYINYDDGVWLGNRAEPGLRRRKQFIRSRLWVPPAPWSAALRAGRRG